MYSDNTLDVNMMKVQLDAFYNGACSDNLIDINEVIRAVKMLGITINKKEATDLLKKIAGSSKRITQNSFTITIMQFIFDKRNLPYPPELLKYIANPYIIAPGQIYSHAEATRLDASGGMQGVSLPPYMRSSMLKEEPQQNYQQPGFQKPGFQQPSSQPTPYQQMPYQQTSYQQTPYQQAAFQQTPYQQSLYKQPPMPSSPYEKTGAQPTPYQQAQYQQTAYQQPQYQQTSSITKTGLSSTAPQYQNPSKEDIPTAMYMSYQQPNVNISNEQSTQQVPLSLPFQQPQSLPNEQPVAPGWAPIEEKRGVEPTYSSDPKPGKTAPYLSSSSSSSSSSSYSMNPLADRTRGPPPIAPQPLLYNTNSEGIPTPITSGPNATDPDPNVAMHVSEYYARAAAGRMIDSNAVITICKEYGVFCDLRMANQLLSIVADRDKRITQEAFVKHIGTYITRNMKG